MHFPPNSEGIPRTASAPAFSMAKLKRENYKKIIIKKNRLGETHICEFDVCDCVFALIAHLFRGLRVTGNWPDLWLDRGRELRIVAKNTKKKRMPCKNRQTHRENRKKRSEKWFLAGCLSHS